MRLRGLLWVLLCVAANTAVGQTGFPYEVLVGDRPVEMRSGPGLSYYVTGKLAANARIEVHQQEPGGWLAIRPTADSFSLVRRSQLEPGDEPGVARVTENDAECRVGSRVERAGYPVCQVRLRKGEFVEVLEELPRPEAGARGERWCRIAPPAGEFRWVQATDLMPSSSAAPLTRSWKVLAALVKPFAPAAAGVQPAAFQEPAEAGSSPRQPTRRQVPPSRPRPNRRPNRPRPFRRQPSVPRSPSSPPVPRSLNPPPPSRYPTKHRPGVRRHLSPQATHRLAAANCARRRLRRLSVIRRRARRSR